MSPTRLGLRISTEERELLEEVCAARGENLSGFVRRAIKKELAALGSPRATLKAQIGVIVVE